MKRSKTGQFVTLSDAYRHCASYATTATLPRPRTVHGPHTSVTTKPRGRGPPAVLGYPRVAQATSLPSPESFTLQKPGKLSDRGFLNGSPLRRWGTHVEWFPGARYHSILFLRSRLKWWGPELSCAPLSRPSERRWSCTLGGTGRRLSRRPLLINARIRERCVRPETVKGQLINYAVAVERPTTRPL